MMEVALLSPLLCSVFHIPGLNLNSMLGMPPWEASHLRSLSVYVESLT